MSAMLAVPACTLARSFWYAAWSGIRFCRAARSAVSSAGSIRSPVPGRLLVSASSWAMAAMRSAGKVPLSLARAASRMSMAMIASRNSPSGSRPAMLIMTRASSAVT